MKNEHIVELWTVKLCQFDFSTCLELLDESEIRRSEQFRIQKVSKQFVVARGILRKLLAGYMNVAPKTLKFEKNNYGKPYLAGEGESDGVVFNISHSGDWLAVAIGFRLQLGVDIERWRDKLHFSALVERYFAKEEGAYWKSLPEHEKQQAFYRLWTQKESFVKAVGRGIAFGLDQCVISPGNSPSLSRIPENCGMASEWSLLDFAMPEGYSGGLAANRFPIKLERRDWDKI